MLFVIIGLVRNHYHSRVVNKLDPIYTMKY
jgi:hypothetical protein